MGKFLEYANTSNKKKKEEKSTSKSSQMGNFGKYAIGKTIGLDTLTSDLSSMGKTIEGIYNGWQTRETMDNTRTAVQSIYDRIGKYQEYQKMYGGPDLSELQNSYKAVLDDWDNISKHYGKYSSGDEYNNALKEAKKQAEEHEKMKTADLGVVEKEISDLEGILKTVEGYESNIRGLQTRQNTWEHRSRGLTTDRGYTSKVKESENELSEYLKSVGYESKAALEKDIGEKNLYKNRAEWIQKGIELASVSDVNSESYDKDFAQKSKYEPREKPFMYIANRQEEIYDFINADENTKTKMVANIQSNADSHLATVGYEHMTDQEVATYNYYYNQFGKKKAEEYLNTIIEELGHRKAVERFERYEGKTGKELLFGVEAGLNQFTTGMRNLLNTSDEYIPTDATQQLSGMVREDLSDDGFEILGNSVGQGAYDLITTTSNMLPSILVSSVAGPTVGAGLMGASASGNAYQEMLNLGYDKGQARTYATLVGVSEAGLQRMMGGIGKLGGVSGKLSKVVSGIDNGFARFSIRYGGSVLAEGFEEAAQEVLNPLFMNLAAGYDTGAEVDWSEVVYSGLLGALSGGVMEGPGLATNAYMEKSMGKTIKANERVSEVFDIASNPEVATAYETYTRYANKGINAENVTDSQLGRVYSEARTDAVETLRSKKSTAEQKTNAMQTLAKLSAVETENTVRKEAREQFNVGEETKVTESGDTVDVKDIKIKGSKATFDTEKGEISVDDVTLTQNDAEIVLLAEGIAETEGESIANLFISQYDGKTNAEEYANAFNLATAYAKNNYTYDTILKNKGVLSTEQVNAIYAETRIKADKEAQKSINKLNKKMANTMTYKGFIEDSAITDEVWSKLDNRQKQAVTFIKGFAQATGMNLILKHNPDSKKGGAYNITNNTITIDVAKYEHIEKGLMETIIPTMSHETTHWMEEKSPELWRNMNALVFSTLQEHDGIDEKTRIAIEQARLKGKGRKGTEKEARSEIIARACEDMLSMSEQGKKMFNSLSESEQKTFVGKIKEIIQNLKNWVSELLGTYKSDSYEAKIMRQYEEKLNRLSKLWDEMLVKSVEANQSLEKSGAYERTSSTENVSAEVKSEVKSEVSEEITEPTIEPRTVESKSVEKPKADDVAETPDTTTVQKYVSGNNGTKDGAIINEVGNSSVVKALERDKSDVGTATTKTAGQTIEMDKPVEIVYLPNNKGKDIYATYFMQTKDSRGGQIASINTLGEGAGFDSVFGMDFVNETGFMETVNGKSDVSTTQISKTEFGGNIEVVKQLLNQIFESATPNGIRGQITYTMDNIDVNEFNDVSCSLFSEVSKYLPQSIKSKLGFKSQSFGSIPRYIGFAGVNSSVDTKNAINIDNIETASGKYIDVINELFSMSEKQRNNILNSITQMPTTVEQLRSMSTSTNDVEITSIGTRDLSELSDAVGTDGETLFQYRAMVEDEDIYREMLLKHKDTIGITNEQIIELFDTIDKAVDIISNNLEALDYAWNSDIDDRAFSPVKPNSDTLYKVSLDFSTLCRKRLLQQTIQSTLQQALNKNLSKEESIAIRDELIKIQEEGRKIEVACALCYVESARMKSPKQINKFLNNRENIIREFFANKSGGSIKEKIANAELKARKKLQKDNPNGLVGKNGVILDALTAPKSKMTKADADYIRAEGRKVKESYKLTEHEQAELDVAKKMSADDFTSAKGLENLAKKHPDLFDIYTSFVRNATHSKGIENDTWWRAGDSNAIGDTLIAQMNAENGLRSQSWSDFQVIHLLDYVAATIELSTKGAKRQSYTKVPDYVKLLGNTGDMINMSLVPERVFDGKLSYDGVEGMAYDIAKQLRDEYHETVGTICIGIENEQIRLLLEDNTIDMVIPYHHSSMSKATRKLMHIPTWITYEKSQNESNLSDADAKANAEKYGVEIKKDKMYQKSPKFSEWFNLEEARQIAKLENNNPSDMKAYKKYGKMYGGYMAMQNAANKYLKLCAERGLAPKFSSKDANFTQDANYWKLLIDRKMVDNITGEIIEQKPIKPIFKEQSILEILNDELERYPQVKADQEYATRKVTEKFLSGDMKVDKSTLDAIKKPIDNVTEVNILESSRDGVLNSDRDTDIQEREYSVSEIKDLFNKWNSDEDVRQLADKVFAKVESIINEQKSFNGGKALYPGLYVWPYPIRFLSEEAIEKKSMGLSKGAKGVFGRKQNEALYGITYNIDALTSPEMPNQEKARVLLHEAIHLCTVDAIKSVENIIPRHVDTLSFKADEDWSIERKAALELIQIFEQIRMSGDRDLYGQKTVYEMVAELSNVEFRQFLKRQTLWTRVIDAIKRIFGIDSNNALDNTSKALEKILEIDTNTNPTESDDIRYSERYDEHSVQTALWEAFDHNDMGNDNLIKVSKMPNYFVELLGIDGDFYIYRDHAYEHMVSKEQAELDGRPTRRNGKDINFHNLGIETMTEAMLAIENPSVAIADEMAVGNPAIFMILPVFDENGVPLCGVVSFYSNRKVNESFSTKPHILLTIHKRDYIEKDLKGRQGLVDLIGQAIEEGRIVDFDRKKIRDDLPVIAQLTRLSNITEKSLNVNLSQFRKKVNEFREKNNIHYADRDDSSVYDIMGEKERILKENETFKAEIERLKERLKIERQVTHGNYFNENQLGAVAGHLRNIAKSTYSKEKLVDGLKDVYSFIAHSPELAWEDVFGRCYNIAEEMLQEAKPEKMVDDRYKMILKDIRNSRISLSESQKQEARYIFGKNWNRNFMGKVIITDKGSSLDSKWQVWASMYPDIFDADINGADMVGQLYDNINSLQDASETIIEYDTVEKARWLAREIYNQYWNVSQIKTTADKYDKQIRRLNFEHRRIMTEFREEYNSRAKDKVAKQKLVDDMYYGRILREKDKEVAKQKLADDIHYGKLIHKLKIKKEQEVDKAKYTALAKLDNYKENAERKTRIQRITANALSLNEMLVKNSKDKHVPEIMREPVTALLQAIDFSSKRLLEKGEPTQKDISLSKALSKVKDMMVKATNAHDELVELYGHGLDEDIEKMVDSVDNIMRTVGDNEFVINRMTLEDLQTLDKMVKTIKHAVNKLNKFHTVNHAKGIANLSQESVLYLDSLGKGKIYDGIRGATKKLLDWGNALPYYVFKRYGSGGMKVYEALQDGWDKFAFNTKAILDYANETYTSKEVKEWSKEVKTFKILIPATEYDLAREDYTPQYQEVQLTVPQIMSMYCLNKREQARGHLFKGGIRVADFKDTKGKIVSQSEGIVFTEKDVRTIFDSLTERQKSVADKLQKFMNNECTDWGNEVSMARFGYKAFGEENYFPIQSDKNNLAVNDETEQPNSLFKLLNMSFTKSTIEKANNRIVISDIFDVFAQHTSDMAKYNALALPVLDSFKWYNYTEKQDIAEGTFKTSGVKQSIEKAFGKDGQNYFTTFLKDINGQQEVSRDTLGSGFFKNAKIASVGMNLRVVLLQPTSYTRASAVIDNKYLAKALVHKPKTNKAETYCGIALWKSMGYYDTNIQRGLEAQIKHADTWKDKATDWSMKGAEVADKVTWGYLWNACELEVRDKRKDLKVGSEEFYDAIGKRLREVIYATQVVDSTMTRSQMMRSTDTKDKLLTAFASEPTLSYNMLQDAYMGLSLDARRMGKKEAWKKNGKRMARIVFAYTMTNAIAALIESGFDALRDDEDEEDMLAFMKLYLKNFASDMSITGKIPYIKEIHSMIQGFGSSRSDTQWMEETTKAITTWYKVFATGKGKPSTAIKYSIKGISDLTGLPFYNVYRDTMAVLNKLDLFTAEDLNEMFEDFLD